MLEIKPEDRGFSFAPVQTLSATVCFCFSGASTVCQSCSFFCYPSGGHSMSSQRQQTAASARWLHQLHGPTPRLREGRRWKKNWTQRRVHRTSLHAVKQETRDYREDGASEEPNTHMWNFGSKSLILGCLEKKEEISLQIWRNFCKGPSNVRYGWKQT